MKKKKLEIKMMGIPYWYPVVLDIVLLLMNIIFSKTTDGEYYMSISCELGISFFASWWSVYNLYELLEEDGGEILYTYPISVGKHELKKNLCRTIWYLLLSGIFMLVIGVCLWHKLDMRIIFNILMQSLTFSAAAFFLMAVIKDSGWTALLLFVYVCVGYFTNGELLGRANIYILSYDSVTWREIIYNAEKCFVSSAAFYLGGSFALKCRKNQS